MEIYFIHDAKCVTNSSERVILESRISGSGEVEGIYPRTESVGGERTKEAFLCAVTVSDDYISAEPTFNIWPEEHEFWGVSKLFLGDSVDLLRSPCDFPIRVNV